MAVEQFERVRGSDVIAGLQDWSTFDPQNHFWAQSTFRYLPDQERYQLHWEHATDHAVFSGGFEEPGTLALS